jgi:phosphoglycolate phosphatase
LGVPPKACLFVGDTPVDVATARAAGMVPVAVSWGFRDREELLRAGAVRLLETPADLLSLL